MYKHVIEHTQIVTAQMKWQQDIHLIQLIDESKHAPHTIMKHVKCSCVSMSDQTVFKTVKFTNFTNLNYYQRLMPMKSNEPTAL